MSSTDKVEYEIRIPSETHVNSVYSIVIDLCEKKVNGQLTGEEQVVFRYKKHGKLVAYQPAFDEMDMTNAIINAYKSGVFSPAALNKLKEGISDSGV